MPTRLLSWGPLERYISARAGVRHYVLALVLAVLSIWLTDLLRPMMGGAYLTLPVIAVILSALLGGFGPGIFALVCSVLAFQFFFIHPIGAFFPLSPAAAARLGLFLLLGCLLAWMGASFRRAMQEKVLSRRHAEVQRDGAENRALQQAAVAQLGLSALAREDIQAVMDDAVQVVANTLNVELTKILELSPDGQSFNVRAGVGWQEELAGHTSVPVDRESHAGFTLSRNAPVTVENLREEKRFQGIPLLHDHGVVSGMAVVIRQQGPQGQPYGVFTAHSRQQRSFSVDDVSFLQSVANVVAATIDRVRANEERRQLLEVLEYGDACLVLDREWRFTFVNRMHERVSKTPRDQSLGRNMWEVFPATADPNRKYWSEFHRVMEQRVPAEFEEYFEPLKLWVALSVYPTQAGGVAAFFRDVTPRVQAEEARRRAEALREAVTENSTSAVLLVDEQDRIVYINPTTQRLLGYSMEEMRARSLHWMIHYQKESGEPYPEQECPVVQALARGTSIRGEDFVIRKNGELFPVSVSGSPIVFEDGRRGMLMEAQDITEEWHARRERELFLAALGHDLRNPIAAITVASELLLRKGLPPTEARAVARIAATSARMAELIEDLLDFARSRVTGLPVQHNHVDLREICQTAISEAELAHPERQITLEGDREGFGFWDAARLSQVVQNLLHNALQYGDPEQPVIVRVSAQGDSTVLEVENRGPPVPRELIPHIFDPFRRGSNQGKGLGLGLYISKQIVEAHHGQISVHSDGSTLFRVVLPDRCEECRQDGRVEERTHAAGGHALH